ncbi:MAG: cobyric acid synthase [Chloroflexota bacterium]|nr:cobyric acid synthase [Dehalococcoidia bacterium]MDW8046997.1 cobyric acid synthase [Chloroflexota bacterium]
MSRAKLLMVQGTASSVGKSVLVTALCRVFAQEGIRVAPFKAQNMSLNAAVTKDGREIGRAQAAQAEAAGVDPTGDMNPILLKPEGNGRCQVIVQGRMWAEAPALGAPDYAAVLWPYVVESLERLRKEYELVVIEGAGSPAEVNLRATDLANMRVAREFGAPVILVGDIDRGGVLAHIVGTLELLLPEERALVRGLLINRFRGDLGLLAPGLSFLEQRTGKPVLGVVPYLEDLRVAPEDSVELERRPRAKTGPALDVAVVRLPKVSNFDEFDALEAEPNVQLRFVSTPQELRSAEVIILPGSKATCPDLRWLHESGMAATIRRRAAEGAYVIGICGGFQMLGEYVFDPDRVESELPAERGLGLLPLVTAMASEKVTRRVEGIVRGGRGILGAAEGYEFQGYEIHVGQTKFRRDVDRPLLLRDGAAWRPDGALDATGRVFGSYVHGLFENDGLRHGVLRAVRAEVSGWVPFRRDSEYDRLAEAVRRSVDLEQIKRIAGVGR